MTVIPKTYDDFKIYQGSTFDEILQLQQSDETPIDLTGYDARMQIRSTLGNTLIADLTSGNGGITITPLTGQIDLLLTPTATAALAAGTYRYDLEVFDGTRVDKYLRGTIQVIGETTT